MLAVEIDGGIWTAGRHVTGSGFTRDAEKMSEAAIAGWRVIRVTPKMVEDGIALSYVERALGSQQPKTMLAPHRTCSVAGCMPILPAGRAICQFHQRSMALEKETHER